MDSVELRLQNAPNFRDLGGIAAAGGRVLQKGRVFRSEVLSRIGEVDQLLLAGLKIGAVCDLRHGVEREKQLNRWPAGCAPRIIGLPPVDGLEAVQANGVQSRIADPDFDLAQARAAVAQGYRRMPRSLAPALAAVFDHLLTPPAVPLLIHCTSGKDRSGFVCALLLTALGASRDAVVHDYLLSRQRYPLDSVRQMLRRFLGESLPAERVEALVDIATVDVAYLDAALDQIQSEFGGVETYLQAMAGLDPRRRGRLQDALLS